MSKISTGSKLPAGVVTCPECSARMKALAGLPVGRALQCAKCGHLFALSQDTFLADRSGSIPKPPTPSPKPARNAPTIDQVEVIEDDNDYDDEIPIKRSRNNKAPKKSNKLLRIVVGIPVILLVLVISTVIILQAINSRPTGPPKDFVVPPANEMNRDALDYIISAKSPFILIQDTSKVKKSDREFQPFTKAFQDDARLPLPRYISYQFVPYTEVIREPGLESMNLVMSMYGFKEAIDVELALKKNFKKDKLNGQTVFFDPEERFEKHIVWQPKSDTVVVIECPRMKPVKDIFAVYQQQLVKYGKPTPELLTAYKKLSGCEKLTLREALPLIKDGPISTGLNSYAEFPGKFSTQVIRVAVFPTHELAISYLDEVQSTLGRRKIFYYGGGHWVEESLYLATGGF